MNPRDDSLHVGGVEGELGLVGHASAPALLAKNGVERRALGVGRGVADRHEARLGAGDSGVTGGFVRAADGTITSFDPSGSTATNPTAINAKGDIAGYYNDASGDTHGFLRMASGTITSFDVKNAASTQVYGINRNDTIVGYSFSKGSLQTTGFARTPGGKIKIFALKGATQTMALGINDEGQIIGFYNVSQSPYSHGFVGSPKAGFLSFDVPNGSYTQPASINENGDIAGTFLDANGLYFAFIRTHNLHSDFCRARRGDKQRNPC